MNILLSGVKDINGAIIQPVMLQTQTNLSNLYNSLFEALSSTPKFSTNNKNIIEKLITSNKVTFNMIAVDPDVIPCANVNLEEKTIILKGTHSESLVGFLNCSRKIKGKSQSLVEFEHAGETLISCAFELLDYFIYEYSGINVKTSSTQEIEDVFNLGELVIDIMRENQGVEMTNVKEYLSTLNAKCEKHAVENFISKKTSENPREFIALLNYGVDAVLVHNGTVVDSTFSDGVTADTLLVQADELSKKESLELESIFLPMVLNNDETASSIAELAKKIGYFSSKLPFFDLIQNAKSKDIKVNGHSASAFAWYDDFDVSKKCTARIDCQSNSYKFSSNGLFTAIPGEGSTWLVDSVNPKGQSVVSLAL